MLNNINKKFIYIIIALILIPIFYNIFLSMDSNPYYYFNEFEIILSLLLIYFAFIHIPITITAKIVGLISRRFKREPELKEVVNG